MPSHNPMTTRLFNVLRPSARSACGRRASAFSAAPRTPALADRRDYEVEHYLRVLVTSYAARLRKAFEPDDFEQLFRSDGQAGLFDRPVETIQPRWIRCRRVD